MSETTVIKRVDENEAVGSKQQKVKNIGVATITNEVKKRAALTDLQNRGVIRTVATKDDVQKDLKDTRLQNTLRGTKTRIDTKWKKPTKATSTTAVTKPNVTTLATKKNGKTTAGVAVPKRINSVRMGTTNTIASATTGVGLHNKALLPIIGQNKTKTTTLTTKVIDNKLQQLKIKAETDENEVKLEASSSLYQEDRNLANKSLTTIQEPTKKEGQIKSNDGKLKIVSEQSHSSQLLNDVNDIDEGDAENLILVSDYVNDIYAYLFKLEAEQPVLKNHLEGQAEIYPKMRGVLIDWINEMHVQFHLLDETFQLSVAVIDRYLQAVKDTKRSHLQLVGVTALFLAAKYEELFPPPIDDFIYITDDTYTGNQIRQMELKILKALDCNLSRPLPIHFLRRFSKAADAEDSHHVMSKYFMELAITEYEMAHYKPSEIAAASLFLSLNLLKEHSYMPSGLNNKHWNSTLEWYSRYSPEHLRPIAQKIALIARNAPYAKLKAVYTKYQSSKFQKISTRLELSSILMESIISGK